MHEAMATTLDIAVEQIQRIQHDARVRGITERPRWPMIVLRSPKGWTGPRMVDGLQVEGTFRSHQVPRRTRRRIRSTSSSLRTGFGATGRRSSSSSRTPAVRARRAAPVGARRMGANLHANGGILLRDLRMPDFRKYAAEVPFPGAHGIGDTHVLGPFLRDVIEAQRHPAEFPCIWARRDIVQRVGVGVRGHLAPVECRDRAER